MNIIHEWQYYDLTARRWTTKAQVSLAVAGGADNGWRTFSTIGSPAPGIWRVNVKTASGAIIGRLNFTVAAATTTPPLITQQID
jgi:hypothetical protein